MQSKSVFSSSTIWGIVVASVVGYLDRQGYHVSDLVAPLGSAVAQFINALAQLIPIIVAIRGRFVATQPLHVVGPATPKALGFALVAALGMTGLICGCSQQQVSTGLTEAQAVAYTIANGIETANTASGGALATGLVDTVLAKTHNTGDEALANTLVTQLNSSVIAPAISAQATAIQAKLTSAVTTAGQAAQAAGATPATVQAVQAQVLSDPGVINAAAAAAPTLNAAPAGTIVPLVLSSVPASSTTNSN